MTFGLPCDSDGYDLRWARAARLTCGHERDYFIEALRTLLKPTPLWFWAC